MHPSIIKKLEEIKKRYYELEIMLSDVNVIQDQQHFKKISKEYVNISNLIENFLTWKKTLKEIKKTKLLLNDQELKSIAESELKKLKKICIQIEKKIKVLLIPKNPNDEHSCFIEIRAATGGNEAAIFAGDLFKMYAKYADLYLWKTNIIHISEGEQGGFKEIIARIKGKGVVGKLKFESGGHRVQRIPKTESQGRIHTSTCTVAIMPELPKSKRIDLKTKDLKIDTFRSSGAGGQHVNTTDSAIRITHIPTGQTVECQDERSQHKNKAKALSILTARVNALEQERKNKKNALTRKNLLGTGERSDRNRTYNFHKNRVTDHRINLSLYSLNEILNGKLDLLIQPLQEQYNTNILHSLSEQKL
ncbi:peptide chain release factor 1 [Buchnera aphidicola]|uniref:Peptide chain release factor 1 n=1 Tax=Buchnera aphidicola (Anoecia oenotherae) TaxID=1241833 RepID=A0A4D6XPR4_9GAMM|nr:peptide chain release factor 1 [Buchnera aphidicola]QCI19272.1 peptide chain release factor 1 [Buchnera aphidicola (Anoecia oenotherae)]